MGFFFSYAYVPGYQYCPKYSCEPDPNESHWTGIIVGIAVPVTLVAIASILFVSYLFWKRIQQKSIIICFFSQAHIYLNFIKFKRNEIISKNF